MKVVKLLSIINVIALLKIKFTSGQISAIKPSIKSTNLTDTIVICNILTSWNLYPDEIRCLAKVKTDYKNEINFDSRGFVTQINFNDYEISGYLDIHLISNLNKLNVLNLGINGLYGTIAESIGLMSSLQYLDIDGNQLSGTIPTELGELKGLQYLNLYANLLNSTIPVELQYLTSLQYLNMGVNILFSSIPTELSKLTLLQTIDFSDNQLIGTIPTELSQITTLQNIYLSNNFFSGCISSKLQSKNIVYDNTDLTTCTYSPSSLPSKKPTKSPKTKRPSMMPTLETYVIPSYVPSIVVTKTSVPNQLTYLSLSPSTADFPENKSRLAAKNSEMSVGVYAGIAIFVVIILLIYLRYKYRKSSVKLSPRIRTDNSVYPTNKRDKAGDFTLGINNLSLLDEQSNNRLISSTDYS